MNSSQQSTHASSVVLNDCITHLSNSHSIPITPDNYPILLSGVDTLYLSLSVRWKRSDPSTNLIDQLEELFIKARETRRPVDGALTSYEFTNPWLFNIEGYSFRDYKYILQSSEYTLKISPAMPVEPYSGFSNVYIEIRSETLWTYGYKKAAENITSYLKPYIESKYIAQTSRIDLCTDLIIPASEWTEDLFKNKVCRSSKVAFHKTQSEKADIFEGVAIGKGGVVSARIYDKDLELSAHPNKAWIRSLWKDIPVKEDNKVIRVEFQVRNRALKTMSIFSMESLYASIGSVWSYLTKDWLKFLVKYEKNKDRQIILPWWEAVQNGFGLNLTHNPRVKYEAVMMGQDRLAKLSIAYLENLMASDVAAENLPINANYTLDDCVITLRKHMRDLSITDRSISGDIRQKIIKSYKPASTDPLGLLD